jgi:hypothetical protein
MMSPLNSEGMKKKHQIFFDMSSNMNKFGNSCCYHARYSYHVLRLSTTMADLAYETFVSGLLEIL